LGAGADSIRLALLSILFRSANLPEQYPTARFVIWLKQQGYYEQVVKSVAARGEQFAQELKNLYVSPVLAESLLTAYPELAGSPREVRMLLKETFPQKDEISDDELLSTMETVLHLQSTDVHELPCTLLVFDELQQFIGEDNQRTLQVQNVVEACSSRFGSSLLFVATGQSALEARTNLSKLQDRFTVKVHLSDKDVEQVVREVVLQKKPSQQPALEQVVDRARGEIDRHLNGSKIGATQADAPDLVLDYPLLPTRRRFWERVLRAIDSAGTSAQLRTQLRIVHEAAQQVACEPLGTVVAGDIIYTQQKGAMLQNGTLLREMEVIVQEQDDGTPDGRLRSRLCATIFLINQLPQEGVLSTGLRATADTLADLLVQDLRQGSAELRQRIPPLLDELVERGILMQVEGEHRLQTRESAEWEQDFRRRYTKIADDVSRIEEKRNTAFRHAVEQALQRIRPTQGESNTPRKFNLHFGQEAPSPATDAVPVWVRTGWDVAEKNVREEAQAAGDESPIVYIYLPRQNADALRAALARREAARETLDVRPANPTVPEVIEARKAMETRHGTEKNNAAALVASVLDSARVFQGGGSEVVKETPVEAVEAAIANALVRLFPNFRLADDRRWEQVLRRASQGNADPLSAIGYTGETNQHPVCKEVLTYIGSGGKRGAEVQKHFMGAGYGWPKDAVDGALLALLAGNHLRASRNSQPVTVKALSQSQIGALHFEAEDVTLTAMQRLQVRKMLQAVGLTVNPGEELEAVHQFLRELENLADAASWSPPLPARPSTDTVDALRAKQGNALLLGIYEARQDLEEIHEAWQHQKALRAERWPKWELLTALLHHADGLPAAATVTEQMDALRENRALLADPDPVTPLLNQLADALRDAVQQARQRVVDARDREVEKLSTTPEWNELKDEIWHRILEQNGLGPVDEPDMGTDNALLATLNSKPLRVWESEAAAMPVQLQKTRDAAARRLDPQTRRVSLPSATLKTEAEVDVYLEQVRAEIMKYIERGNPVII